MKNVVTILGAGRVGSAVYHLLSAIKSDLDLQLRIVDLARPYLLEWQQPPASYSDLPVERYDLSAKSEMLEIIKESNTIVCCLPVTVMRKTVPGLMCAQNGVNYIDVTEDVGLSEEHRASGFCAAVHHCTLLPQSGLAPGLINMAGFEVYSRFDAGKCASLQLQVGALPTHPINSLRYAVTWSVEGLVNEYIHPCDAIVDGRGARVAPLDGVEKVLFEGVELEAFNTSGGLGSLIETLSVPNLNYKSLRYPGHRDMMKLLLDDLGFRSTPLEFVEFLKKRLPTTRDDTVFMRVVGTGEKNGQFSQEVWTKKITAETINEVPYTALQRSTAFGAAAMVELLYDTTLPEEHRLKYGLVKQEEVGLDAMSETRLNKLVGLL